MIQRQFITNHLKKLLERVDKPVGLAESPIDGGWRGEPNSDGTNFVPYTVITPNSSSAPSGYAEGPISEWQPDWRLSYSISSYGVKPEQCEWMADEAREILDAIVNTHVSSGGNNYLIQQMRVDMLGGLIRVDATDPPYWGQSDQISVWLSEE